MKVDIFLRHSARFVWDKMLLGIEKGVVFPWLRMGDFEGNKIKVVGPSVFKSESQGFLWVSLDDHDTFPRGLDIHLDFGFVSWDIVVTVSAADMNNTVLDMSIYEFIPNDRLGIGQRMLLKVLRSSVHTTSRELRRFVDNSAWKG